MRAVILALLVSIPVVAQTRVTVCWIEPAPSVRDSPFSHQNPFSLRENKLRVGQAGFDLIQRAKLDWTRIVIPPELKARPMGDA